MKKSAFIFIIIGVLIFMLSNQAFAVKRSLLSGNVFVEEAKENMNFPEMVAEMQFGLGEEFSRLGENNVSQDLSLLGVSWEHNLDFGFYYFNAGYAFFGTEETDFGSTVVSDESWDNQNFGMYLGGGYTYITCSAIFPDVDESVRAFFGGGFDVRFLYGSWNQEETGTVQDYYFYTFELAFIATAGVKIPAINLAGYINFSMNFLVDWERHLRTESGGNTTNVDASDTTSMTIPIVGFEIGAIYRIPVDPKLHFGVSINILDAFYFKIMAGFVFK